MVDAVDLEPVSASKFPANREENREFRRIRPLNPILNAGTRANSEACGEIPYSTEQGIFVRNREFAREHREFKRAIKAERLPDDIFGRDTTR